MSSKYNIYDISSSGDSDKEDLGVKINNDSTSSSEDNDHIILPVRYLASQQQQNKSIDAATHNKPNYSSLKKKTISENQHTVTVKRKKGPVFYQGGNELDITNSTNKKKKTSKNVENTSVIFFQDKGEDTSSTTEESSVTTSEDEDNEETLSKLKEKPILNNTTLESKKPVIQKNLLDSFLGINLSSPISNLFMKNVNTKLNYNENVLFNASETGNAFDEQNLKKITTTPQPVEKKPIQQTTTKPLIEDKNSFNVYLNKSSKTKDVLENLSLPYHCHIRGMCKGDDKNNKRVHELEKTDETFMNSITDYITEQELTPKINKDVLSMVLFSRKYSDFEEQKFIMVSKEIFNQEVLTKDYEVLSQYGTNVIMIELVQKPRFDEFFKDQGLSKIIKLNFHIPGRTKKCGFLFYLSDEGMYSEERKVFIHKSSDKEDKAPPLIMVFNKYDDGLRLGNLWIFYGEKQEMFPLITDNSALNNDINEDIKKYVNSYMNKKQ